VSTGVVALMIYYKGLSKTPVHITTMLELTFPFIAIFIDMTLYNTTLSVSQLIFAVVLSFAIYKIAKLQSNAVVIKTN
jgi:drug/metabolite transporter (DMT)-like permease